LRYHLAQGKTDAGWPRNRGGQLPLSQECLSMNSVYEPPAVFLEMAGFVERLTELHLLKSDELDPPVCRFDGGEDERVGKEKKEGLRYDLGDQRVYINATQ
jgi:hypothetical protein